MDENYERQMYFIPMYGECIKSIDFDIKRKKKW